METYKVYYCRRYYYRDGPRVGAIRIRHFLSEIPPPHLNPMLFPYILALFCIICNAEKVITPAGWMDAECVHKYGENVPSTKCLSNSKIALHPELTYYSGWVALAGQSFASPIEQFSAEWTVPPSPSFNFLTTLFFFPGLEDQHPKGSLILQPVLQYGFSGCGGGPFWSFTAFIVNLEGRALCGKMLRVNEGDRLLGNITRTGEGAYDVSAQVLSGSNSQISVKSIENLNVELKYAAVVMEGIRIYSCKAYPSNHQLEFSNIKVKLADDSFPRLSLQPTVSHTECGQNVQIKGGKVVVKFESSATMK